MLAFNFSFPSESGLNKTFAIEEKLEPILG